MYQYQIQEEDSHSGRTTRSIRRLEPDHPNEYQRDRFLASCLTESSEEEKKFVDEFVEAVKLGTLIEQAKTLHKQLKKHLVKAELAAKDLDIHLEAIETDFGFKIVFPKIDL